MAHTVVDRQIVYDGKKVRLEIHHLEDPDTGKRHKREVCVHSGAVVVLPLLDNDRVLLIKNYRYAVGESLLELPAGTLERGEEPINCAGRELIEETGYTARRIKPLGSFFSSPGILSERMYAFAAYDLRPGEASPEEGEDIELRPTPWEDALDMIRSGAIRDAKTIAAMLMYDRFHRGK
jgi:ADP-ribose pyrophosphatase